MQDREAEAYQHMPTFGGICKEVLEIVLESSEIMEVPKGEFFFREAAVESNMFVLKEGRVAVLKSWEGHEYLLAYLSEGDCFGEMELLDLCPRTASVLAVEDCVAVRIPVSALHMVYKKDPMQYAMIYMNMGREVARRLRDADERLLQTRVEANLTDGHYVFEDEDGGES